MTGPLPDDHPTPLNAAAAVACLIAQHEHLSELMGHAHPAVVQTAAALRLLRAALPDGQPPEYRRADGVTTRTETLVMSPASLRAQLRDETDRVIRDRYGRLRLHDARAPLPHGAALLGWDETVTLLQGDPTTQDD